MTVWVILYWVGAAQAAMLAAALWRSRSNAHANRVLSAWLGVIAVDLAVNPSLLAGYKKRLRLRDAPLFDTAGRVRELETCLQEMLC